MKRIISLLCVVCLLMSFTTISVTARKTPEGLEYQIENLNFDTWVTITGYTGDSTELIIPDTIEGYPVASIAKDAFWGDSIQSIHIPETIKRIGSRAFLYCTELKSVYITDLDAWCHIEYDGYACSPLAYADDLYLNGALVKDLVIPETVSVIGVNMFSYSNLRSVFIPNSVTEIHGAAFENCTSLTSVTIPSSVRFCADDAFKGCTNLKEFKVDKGNLVYDSRNDCNAIIETSTNSLIAGCMTTIIPNTVTSIEPEAFYKCTGLKSVTIPGSVISVGMEAFAHCSNLNEVKILEGVDCISSSAFYECTSLASVFIPLSVTEIESMVFDACSEDLTIYGYADSYAEAYAIENGINFNSIGEVPPITPPEDQKPTYDMNVYSDRSGMNVEVGKTIRLGVAMLEDGIEKDDASGVSFILDDSSIIKPLNSFVEDNVYFVEFEALKSGTSFVTFSDSDSGFVAKVPVTAYDKSKTSFTLSSIMNYVNGYYLKDVASVSGVFADNYSYEIDETTGKATVTFDAYNTSYIFGAVEIYNAEGKLVDAVVLDKYESGATSLKEIFVDNPFHLYTDFVEGNYFSDTFYRAQTYSKKTSVSVMIPKGGYINITIDAYNSDIVAIANAIDMLLQVKDVAGDLKGYREDSGKFIKLTTEKAVEKIIKESIKPKSIAKKLVKGLSKEFLMTKNSMGTFMDSVVNNVNTLDINTFVIETAKGFAWGVSEKVAIALTGSYSKVIETLLTAGKLTEIGNQYLDLVQSMESGTVSIHNQEGDKRTSEDVTVKCETSFDNDVALKVFHVVPESDFLENVEEKSPDLYKAMMNDLTQVYNISMIKNGEETQPEEEVEVYITLPLELLPYTGMGNVKVYRAEDDGTFTDMNARLDGDFLVFTTEHFSLYVLAVEIPEIPSEPEVTYLLGDVNGDGKVNVKDATEIQKAAAGLSTLTEMAKLSADADLNEKVNVKDATAIQKFSAGLETGYPIGEERKSDSVKSIL